MFKFNLGDEVKSIISGFKGIIVVRSENLNGCHRYWVSPKIDKDGKLPESYWFDEVELVLLTINKIKHKEVKTGGLPSKIK